MRNIYGNINRYPASIQRSSFGRKTDRNKRDGRKKKNKREMEKEK